MSDGTNTILLYCFLMTALGLRIQGDFIAFPQAQPVTSAQPRLPNRTTESAGKINFITKGMGEVKTAGGNSLPFTSFEASNGIALIAITGEFESSDRATKQLDTEIERARKVLQRGRKTEKSGKAIGKRARIILPSTAPDDPTLAIVWTDGRYFHEIVSTSWKEMLELEKKYVD